MELITVLHVIYTNEILKNVHLLLFNNECFQNILTVLIDFYSTAYLIRS